MFKKFISYILISCISVISLSSSVSATTLTAAGDVTTTLEITLASEGFAITVPTALAVDIDYNGNCTCATNASIKNYSSYPIEIASVQVYSLASDSETTLVDWADSIESADDNAIEFSFKLNDACTFGEVQTQDTKKYRELTITDTTLANDIAANSSLALTYAMVCEPFVVRDGTAPIGGIVFVFQKATI